jgi:AcrR family transcriptional regulator
MTEHRDDTKTQLLTAAERLFAEYGIEAVSARQIALAAGQLNQSAIRYHFGTKDGLIETLLKRRMAEIDELRGTMVETLGHEGRLQDLRSLVGAIALPLAAKIANTPNGGDYVRFLAHLFADRQRRDTIILQGKEAALLRSIYRMLRGLIPELPESIWSERLRLVIGCIINSLADRERMRASSPGRKLPVPEAAFVSNLIDAGLAILTAPISAATLEHLTPEGTHHQRRSRNGTDG